MYDSTLKQGLAQKYEDKELAKMWSRFWSLAKVMAVLGVLYVTHTLMVFSFVVACVILFVIYKLNRI